MRVDLFDYDLPLDLIALRPASPREDARLLVVDDSLDDRYIGELPEILRPGDLLVCNDTRVLPTQLFGRTRSAKIAVTLVRQSGVGTWDGLAKPARKLRVGDVIGFAPGVDATVAHKGEGGQVTLKFGFAGDALKRTIDRIGVMPLPPYITRRRAPDAQDYKDYQTIFASQFGAVAAPTAGLHFTPRLMKRLEAASIGWVPVTLHVGAGTFLPLRVDDTDQHRMHPETGAVSRAAAAHVNRARAEGGRIVAVGTTSLRILETAADDDGVVHPFEGETDLFITPGYRFKTAEVLLTNFHLPRSTLFMLACAFAGVERVQAAYEHAIQNHYRFYSYGDATLLQRIES